GAQVFMLIAWNVVIRILWRLEETTMLDLNMTVFTHLMTMSQRFFNNRFGGSLVSQVNKFVGAFERMADTLVWNIYKLILAFIFTAAILIRPAPLYVAGILLLAVVYVIAVYKVKKRELSHNEAWAARETKRTGQLADSITNIAAVKAFAHEERETMLFKKRADTVWNASLGTMKITLKHELITNLIQRSMFFASIGIALWLAISGNEQVGLVYLILVYTNGIIGRLWELNRTFRDFNRAFGDARDMTDILSMEPDIKDPAEPLPVHIQRGDIAFKGVQFQHNDKGSKIFKGLELHLKPGEKIGLVGPSGSGKTTLTQLLLRLMDIQKGEILIDGQNIAHLRQTDLRDHIAYVPQEPMMFHRSIKENIRYGRLEASDKEVIAAAKMANAHEFIQTLQDGYDTLVGERGTKLSGGQRQRVAIARAMLKNAPILVLDEATSALDSESEVLIQDALWRLMQGRTAIVIAHRLSTIQKMDRILVLEKGTIVEQGTHRELLRTQGVYAKLWTHQSGGFIED
ncbi:MAG TPA: ABC transporter ATP-binding protein, partial [Candidatus Saccharimonadales bacterium]|nr:ABC transporter ATP-binding protein [Candidatus Saccharimonadales bacterium]